MNDRKEYLKNYRLNNKEKYRQYQAKYRKNHLSTYEKLKQENQQLKDRINTYENPEDLTLMFMYCNEKTKDKIKDLQDRINKAIEYINQEMFDYMETPDLLEILKGDNNEC